MASLRQSLRIKGFILASVALLLAGCSGLDRARVVEYRGGSVAAALSGAGLSVHGGNETCAVITYRGEFDNRVTAIKNCTPEQIELLKILHQYGGVAR